MTESIFQAIRLHPDPVPDSVPLDPTRTGREAGTLEAGLRERIVGQDAAIQEIVNIYQMHRTGLCAPGRPVGNFLFLGPTGSGKTRTVEATAEALIGTPRAVIKIDCAEFQHSHEIAKLIGSPPGYLGHRETHPLLSQEVLGQYHTDKVRLSFVLFDEIEKASDALWNLLLGILDKGTLTLGDNRRVDFSRAMVFMTSNLGASEMTSILNPRLGFSGGPTTAAAIRDSRTEAQMERSGVEAARRKFTPEFMNRIDKVVTFRPLGESELNQVLDIELRMVQERILCSGGETRFVFQISEPARRRLLELGTDVRYGARHLKRAIERTLVQPMSNLIASEQVRAGDKLKVDLDPGGQTLTFSREASGLPLHEMAAIAGTSSLLALSRSTGNGAQEAARASAPRAGRRTII
jgi:ATP-dependent Clp protease ATP-binding subunit ClpA